MDTGEHVFTPENEKIYDTVKRQWAAVSTTVKGRNEKIEKLPHSMKGPGKIKRSRQLLLKKSNESSREWSG